MAGAAVPRPFWMPVCELSSYPLDLIGSAASLHFGQLLRHRVSYHLRSLVKKFAPLDPVIGLKDVIGLLSESIDNWGLVGGLIGGAAASWLIGPAWKHESTLRDGR